MVAPQQGYQHKRRVSDGQFCHVQCQSVLIRQQVIPLSPTADKHLSIRASVIPTTSRHNPLAFARAIACWSHGTPAVN